MVCLRDYLHCLAVLIERRTVTDRYTQTRAQADIGPYHCSISPHYSIASAASRVKNDIRSQWSSGFSAPDCAVRGPMQFRTSQRAVVFIMTATAICSLGHGLLTLTTVPRSTQFSTLHAGAVK